MLFLSSVPQQKIILGVESSCDETAIAVLKGSRCVLSSQVASQAKVHARFGGVVPEIAAREHLAALDAQKRTPLLMAVSGSLYSVSETLLSSSEPRATPTWALHIATIRRDVRMVQLLLEHGADVDAQGRHGQGTGWTPLCLAARTGAVDVVRALLSARANVHAISANGKSALEIGRANRGRIGGEQVLEVLHLAMVESILEIASQFQRHAPPKPTLAPTQALLAPERLHLPPSMQSSDSENHQYAIQSAMPIGRSMLTFMSEKETTRPILWQLHMNARERPVA